jgi:hypothetical protein
MYHQKEVLLINEFGRGLILRVLTAISTSGFKE